MKAIMSNLKDHILEGDDHILWCPTCGSESSGNRGDYWPLPENHVFTCPTCGSELHLVEKRITVEYVE